MKNKNRPLFSNRLMTIKDAAAATIANFTYDPLSRRTQLSLANSTSTTYQYDAVSRLTSLQSAAAGNRSYTYDKIGNRKTMTDPAGIHAYGYDALAQLTSVDEPSGFAFTDTTFTYDALGNRTQAVAGAATTYTTNALNQYASIQPPASSLQLLQYDSNGNLTSDGTRTYTYDAENRLLSANATGLAAGYTYDPLGRRLSKTVGGVTTRFLYDGDQLIAETSAAGAITAKYVYGPGIDEPLRLERGGLKYYYHHDGLGSVVALTNASGALVESYAYDVYGQPSAVSAVGNRFLFTGREYDSETGLYYYRARYYNPQVGRFLSRDPLGYLPDTNLYRYVWNNPLNRIDPSGLITRHAFQESAGQVVINAEHYDSKISRNGKDWTFETTVSGYSGTGHMRATPDGTVVQKTNYQTLSPELIYNVQFATAGTYYIWARGAGGGSDSYHAGIDNTAPASAAGIGEFGSSWGWNSTSLTGRPSLSVSSPGLHTIHIWMRHDGFPIDKILLRTDSSLTAPSGTGPAESARVTIGEGDTAPPLISGIAVGSVTASSATITWTTNEASDTQIEYGTTTSYGQSTTLNTSLVTSHSASLSGLSASTLYHYRVKSRDAAGNLATSPDATFTTAAPPDTTAPTVSLSAPANNSTVSGTSVTVSATASDNVGVIGVQFKLDGANLGAEDVSSPYSIVWNTTTAGNGSHTLTAVARDAAGNSTTSSGVTVTVGNVAQDTTPPSGSITINGGTSATNTMAVTLTLSSTDNSGTVAQMRFSNDGTTYSTAEPYATTKTWTLTGGDGTKTVLVKFADAAGNWSAAATDTITLDMTPPQLNITSPADGAVIVAP